MTIGGGEGGRQRGIKVGRGDDGETAKGPANRAMKTKRTT